MRYKRNISIINLLIFLIALTSTMVLFRISGNSFFKILVIITILWCIIFNIVTGKGISIHKLDKHYLLIYSIKIFTVLGAIYYIWGDSWKNAAIIQFFWFSMYTLLYIFISNISVNTLDKFRKGIIITILIQFIWCFIQIIARDVYGIDINTLVFRDFLSMVSEASQIKFGVVSISGLAWHPINLAPILIIAYCIFNKVYYKIIIFILAIITNNSTVLIGVVVCFSLDFIFGIKDKRKIHRRIKYQSLLFIFLLVLVGGVILIKTDIISRSINSFIYLYQRLNGDFYDGGSTAAHIRYYTSIPEMFNISSLYKILFGYGEGCSGYLMGILYNQYTHLSSWAMESDIVNILISNGVIGFLLFYSWLFMIAIRGLKIDKKYFICIMAIIICGITYNVQYDWVIVFEMFLAISVKYKYNIFLLKSNV